MTFTIFDIIILTIFSASSLMGIYRGMVCITINLLGFVASIFAAIFLYSYVRIIFSGYVENDLVTSIASGVASYIFSLIVFTFLTSKIVLLFKDLSLGFFDRLLGFAVGIIRGGLISLLIFAVVAIFMAGTYTGAEEAEDVVNNLEMEKYPEWLKDSVTTVYLERALKEFVSYIPKELWGSIKMPKSGEKSDEERINEIKRKKGSEVQSSIIAPLSKILEDEVFSEEDEE
jgi:membrane protein required for colicin V production